MDCPAYIKAFLLYLEEELNRIMENRAQEEYESPFRNSGNVEGYRNDTFEVHAYDWGWDEEDGEQLVNFKFEDIEITWYKWFGRATWLNRYVTEAEAIRMFTKCLDSLHEDEKRFEKEEKIDES